MTHNFFFFFLTCVHKMGKGIPQPIWLHTNNCFLKKVNLPCFAMQRNNRYLAPLFLQRMQQQ